MPTKRSAIWLVTGITAVLALVAFAPAASAQTYTGQATVTVSDLVASPGEPITVVASGYAAGATVTFTLNSDPIHLGTATADAQGTARLTFTIPTGVPAGDHTLVASGLDASGNVLTLSTRLTVMAAGGNSGGTGGTGGTGSGSGSGSGSSSGSLPRTGSDNTNLVRAGALLIAAGGAAVLVTRKRSTRAKAQV